MDLAAYDKNLQLLGLIPDIILCLFHITTSRWAFQDWYGTQPSFIPLLHQSFSKMAHYHLHILVSRTAQGRGWAHPLLF